MNNACRLVHMYTARYGWYTFQSEHLTNNSQPTPPPGSGGAWPVLRLGLVGCFQQPNFTFIINGFAGHVGNFYISIHFIINGFPGL